MTPTIGTPGDDLERSRSYPDGAAALTSPIARSPSREDEEGLRRMLKKATTRLGILRDRMNGCDAATAPKRHATDQGHELSRFEIDGWIEEQEAALSAHSTTGAHDEGLRKLARDRMAQLEYELSHDLGMGDVARLRLLTQHEEWRRALASRRSVEGDEGLAVLREKAAAYDRINTPEIDDFLSAVRNEALHQRERWGVVKDGGKEASDWFWLVGYLAGKALHDVKGKRLHHLITTAAALLNWHGHQTGHYARMRPGIEEPASRPLPATASGCSDDCEVSESGECEHAGPASEPEATAGKMTDEALRKATEVRVGEHHFVLVCPRCSAKLVPYRGDMICPTDRGGCGARFNVATASEPESDHG